jgi:hypothetical protein
MIQAKGAYGIHRYPWQQEQTRVQMYVTHDAIHLNPFTVTCHTEISLSIQASHRFNTITGNGHHPFLMYAPIRNNIT